MIKRVLIIGPRPPAIGGIASIVASIKDELKGDGEIIFLDSSKPNSLLCKAFRPIKLIIGVMVRCLTLSRGGRVLMFSSSNWSFWEKCIWSTIVRMTGAKAIMVMVSGKYPIFYESMSQWQKCLARYFVENMYALVVQSLRWEEYYKNIFPFANIQVVSAGVDTKYFRPPDTKKKANIIRILYVGWMLKAKGTHDLLLAASMLDKKGILFSIRMVGPVFDNLQNMHLRIMNLGLEGKVVVVGPVKTREELLREYHSADIFVLPSHGEGFPVALLEAVSCGLACIGTRVGGIPDILDGGNNGLLVEPNFPSKIAESIIYLMENPQLRYELGCKARSKALKEFALDDCLRSYKNILGIERLKGRQYGLER